MTVRLIYPDDYAILAGVHARFHRHDLYTRLVFGNQPELKPAERETLEFEELMAYPTALQAARDLARENDRPAIGIEVVKRPATSPRRREWEANGYAYVVDETAAQYLPILPLTRTSLAMRAEGWGDKVAEPGTNVVPSDVFARAQGVMASNALPAVVIAVAVDGRRVLRYEVARDAAIGARLVAEAERFWTEHVLARKEPPIDASESCRRWLLERSPADKRRRLRPASEAEKVLAESLMGIRRDLQRIGAMEAELENRLRSASGDDAGIYGPGFRVTWCLEKGRVGYKDVLAKLTERFKLPKVEVRALVEANRGRSWRRFEVKFDDR